MSRKPPAYVERAGVIGAPIDYDWNDDLGLKLYGTKDQNVKLYKTIDGANFKAKMALGVAISEWIILRFDGHADLKDAHQRLEAAWASAVHSAYAKDLRFKLVRPPVFGQQPAIDGPLKLALNFLGDIDAHYATGNIYLAEPIVKQAMLARHVMAKRKSFEDWMKAALQRAKEVLPRKTEYDEATRKYDASSESPVPREFFDPSFTYNQESAAKALREFLSTLDPGTNAYLHTAEQAKAKGFSGKPYTL